MTAYEIFEFIVIALIVGASANHVIRKYAPAVHRAVLIWMAARVGIKLAAAPVAEAGCGSGCNSCGTGCSTDGAEAKPQQATEQPLSFRPRKV